MKEKAVSGMMAETHKRDTGVNQRIGQLEIVTKQKDEKITQLAENVTLLQQQCESYRNIAIQTNVNLGSLPVSNFIIH